MEKLLKEMGLDENQINKIIEIHNNLISEKETQIKELEASVNFKNGELDKLKEDLKTLNKVDTKELESEIKNLLESNKKLQESHFEEIKSLKINSAIEKALIQNNAKNIKMGKALLDLEKINLDEKGNILGLNEQMEMLLKDENTSFLFDKKEPSFTGAKPTESSEVPINTTNKNLTYQQFLQQFENN